MKKIFILFVFIGLAGFANAQEIGARFGDAVGGNVAIDGIISIGEFSRVHADVSFGNGVGVEALWDFLYKRIGGEAFDWYVGAGPSILFDDPFFFGISGEVGIEYHFNEVPIALGLDWRPTFWLIENTDFYGGGFGFNARFVFGK
ncbi:MAG: outer membrane insertion C- signal [Flammeovirgaceae bacterium]|nr:outer membrane insertion C- signal [Flammeovirgaceae bacterium]